LTRKKRWNMLVKRRKQKSEVESLKRLIRAEFAVKEPRKKNSLKEKNEAKLVKRSIEILYSESCKG
jgi:hypothetical protein